MEPMSAARIRISVIFKFRTPDLVRRFWRIEEFRLIQNCAKGVPMALQATKCDESSSRSLSSTLSKFRAAPCAPRLEQIPERRLE